MPDQKNIHLQRYPDGTPSVLRKKTVYQDLYFYRKSDVLVQLTKAFCDRFMQKHGDRTVDQMVQAARSTKQNIAEGLTDGQTSFETEMKLLGIAQGSNQELLEDFQDYLKHKNLPLWGPMAASASTSSQPRLASAPRLASPSSLASASSSASPYSHHKHVTPETVPSPRYDKLLSYCRYHNDLNDYKSFFYQWTDEEMANTAVCLCHMVDKMMEKFLEQRDREFVEEGGIRERMTAARLDRRGTQKQIIVQQAEEIAQLKARIASQERELAMLRSSQKNG